MAILRIKIMGLWPDGIKVDKINDTLADLKQNVCFLWDVMYLEKRKNPESQILGMGRDGRIGCHRMSHVTPLSPACSNALEFLSALNILTYKKSNDATQCHFEKHHEYIINDRKFCNEIDFDDGGILFLSKYLPSANGLSTDEVSEETLSRIVGAGNVEGVMTKSGARLYALKHFDVPILAHEAIAVLSLAEITEDCLSSGEKLSYPKHEFAAELIKRHLLKAEELENPKLVKAQADRELKFVEEWQERASEQIATELFNFGTENIHGELNEETMQLRKWAKVSAELRDKIK